VIPRGFDWQKGLIRSKWRITVPPPLAHFLSLFDLLGFEIVALTCLSKGSGYYCPPTHILQLCGFRLLLECPIDLSSLAVFSPIPAAGAANLDASSGLLRALPWYKTVPGLHLWDPSLIDAVLVSSPAGMLGLPFLTRNAKFCGKIYVTEVVARIGQLLMEDLLSMHAELLQFYGADVKPASPEWMKWEELEKLSPELKQVVLGEDGEELGAWMPLYSTANTCTETHEIRNNDMIVDNDPSLRSASALSKVEIPHQLFGTDETSDEIEKISFLCSCIIDSLEGGGSVLIPVGRLGTVLLLLEQISDSLESFNLKVPIFMISPTAEETLAFVNTVPEWLSKQRQQKLFSGEALFNHVELRKVNRLHVFPSIYSSELLMMWQEPCIIFSPHWSLRLGPVVPLLHRWHADPKSLLILEQGVNVEVALLPFRPVAIKVLQCSFLSGIMMHKVEPVLEILHPKLVLYPEDLRIQDPAKENNSWSYLYYSENVQLRVPSFVEDFKACLETNLTFQLRPRRLTQQNIAIARLKGRIFLSKGKYFLAAPRIPMESSNKQLLYWGSIEPTCLLMALQERGLVGTIHWNEDAANSVCTIQITNPEKAVIETSARKTTISCEDENTATLIYEALGNLCDGI
ncbi:Beta-Casp domain, partial [Musa troglodytarum]